MSGRAARVSLILAPPVRRRGHPARRPVILAALAVALAWGTALAAATLLPGVGELVGGFERAAFGASDGLGRLATLARAGYAFSLGMVAAVNPCGFALLPAYLALYVGTTGDAPDPLHRQLARAGAVGAAVTLGFVALFGLAGAILTLATVAIGGALAWLGAAVGTALVATGGLLLGGGRLPTGAAGRLANRLGGATRRPGVAGYFAYGVAYGLASLGCALPLFLGVVGTALATEGPFPALRQYLLYALGMGAVVTALTVVAALARRGLAGAARRAGRLVAPLGPLLLALAGAYVIHYWLVNGALLDGLRRR